MDSLDSSAETRIVELHLVLYYLLDTSNSHVLGFFPLKDSGTRYLSSVPQSLSNVSFSIWSMFEGENLKRLLFWSSMTVGVVFDIDLYLSLSLLNLKFCKKSTLN